MLTWGTITAVAAQKFRDILPLTNSPYSRLGLGNPYGQFFTPAASMGGLSAAFQDPYYLNLRNPASLAFLREAAFEVGIDATYHILSGQGESAGALSGNLNYLGLGFPLKNVVNEALDRKSSPFGWGMAFALQPYTNVGYNLVATIQNGEGIGPTSNAFKGSGGTYRLMWGNAARIKNFSVGMNASFLFGKISRSQIVVFDSLRVSYVTEFLDESSFSGLILEGGIQYAHEFKKSEGARESATKRIIFGVSGNLNNSFTTNSSRFYFRELPALDLDTIVFESDVRRPGTLPAQLIAGVFFEQMNKWRLGVEAEHGWWSAYRNEAKPEQLRNAWGLRLGGEYIPNFTSYNRYFDRVRYRFGAFYQRDPRSFNGGQLQDYGLSFGMGMPIIRPRQQTTFINLGLEMGRFGQSDFLQETYFRMALGFTLNDNTWFFKRKFN
jgi:hypothetical protein